ncbi:hypothetical protein HF521_002796 [Silurus meridionalis]|uniref:Uncharacterized protein n=1 Tax=Silurus meridionalis TaxID=175797 RepID=A0A8T0B259_SILME|nr:hypothetical protein HF521_002796 [Silurus meridionalis]
MFRKKLVALRKPVQCQDDPYGFNAEVVDGNFSKRLRQCIPIVPVYRTQNILTTYINERVAAIAEDASESRHQMQEMSNANNRGLPTHRGLRSVWPPNTDVDNNSNRVTFTDGETPVSMAVGGMRNYKPPQMESLGLLEEEVWDKRPSAKKKAGKRGGKKSRRKHRQ